MKDTKLGYNYITLYAVVFHLNVLSEEGRGLFCEMSANKLVEFRSTFQIFPSVDVPVCSSSYLEVH